jgi:LmbE family N-acetylglucosaminyl deacetylase
MRPYRIVLLFFTGFIAMANLWAQSPKVSSAVDIYKGVQKLNTLASVLYIAAHPDDENTRLISYLSNHLDAQVGYLSITRGDGGQNLIGPELRDLLGVIRTQELLAARRIDGGEQFFTRANDFGYSKHPDEAFAIWSKEAVIKDVVWIIRNFKPDVIINRFDHRTPGSTHGHHTGSAIASVEAFTLAADPNFAPEQLAHTQTWSPYRQFFNTSWWFYGSEENFEKADKSKLVSFDIGSFDPKTGLSNNEIAAQASSQHLSQGFGRMSQRGSSTEYVELINGPLPQNNDLFEGIDTSWNRVSGGKKIGKILSEVENNFNFQNPAVHLKQLLEAYQLILNLDDSHWRNIKTKEISKLIQACAGLHVDFKTTSPNASAGSEISVGLEIIARNTSDIAIEGASVNGIVLPKVQKQYLKPNEDVSFDNALFIPQGTPYSVPYWLTKTGTLGLYRVDDQALIGLPQTPRSLVGQVNLSILGMPFQLQSDLTYHHALPDVGEIYQPFEIVPKVDVALDSKSFLFADSNPQNLKLKITAHVDNCSGEAGIRVPEGWTISPTISSFNINNKGESLTLDYVLHPPSSSAEANLTAFANIDGQSFEHELLQINYTHIPVQTILRPSEAKAVRLDINTVPLKIAFIAGAGDVTVESLARVGLQSDLIQASDISPELLSNYDVVITGIRAYNTVDDLKFKQNDLLDFVKQGGTMLVQYNVNRGIVVDQLAPVPIELSRDRVTDEFSPVEILDPTSPLMSFPNQLSSKDFDGWVQERGLYFPSSWNSAFKALLRMNDPNEPPTDGSVLVTDYGKGHYIYTGLSFFRQFPESVPGAYRFFVNLISIGKFK